jgi:hypothetical protein
MDTAELLDLVSAPAGEVVGHLLPGQLLDEIPMPQDVLDFMREQGFKHLSDQERLEKERDYKISCLFKGKDVAYRQTPRGLRIFFTGTISEMVEWIRGLTEEERNQVEGFLVPPPLDELVEEWRGRRTPKRMIQVTGGFVGSYRIS